VSMEETQNSREKTLEDQWQKFLQLRKALGAEQDELSKKHAEILFYAGALATVDLLYGVIDEASHGKELAADQLPGLFTNLMRTIQSLGRELAHHGRQQTRDNLERLMAKMRATPQ